MTSSSDWELADENGYRSLRRVKGTMRVRVASGDDGRAVLDETYVEEHRDRTSVYNRPFVGYLQANHLAEIAQGIIEAVKADRASRPRGSASGRDLDTKERPSDASALEEKLRMLERLRRDGLVSEGEYRQRRKALLDRAL
jgi:hypothetical protein